MNSQPTRIVALFNQAGGVAKTTLTQNLGYHLAQRKHRVLLVDMDPQASLTKFMGLIPKELDKTITDAIIEELPLHDLEGYAIAATKNQVFEAILIMMLRSLQAISRAFFMINLPSRVERLFAAGERERYAAPLFGEGIILKLPDKCSDCPNLITC